MPNCGALAVPRDLDQPGITPSGGTADGAGRGEVCPAQVRPVPPGAESRGCWGNRGRFRIEDGGFRFFATHQWEHWPAARRVPLGATRWHVLSALGSAPVALLRVGLKATGRNRIAYRRADYFPRSSCRRRRMLRHGRPRVRCSRGRRRSPARASQAWWSPPRLPAAAARVSLSGARYSPLLCQTA